MLDQQEFPGLVTAVPSQDQMIHFCHIEMELRTLSDASAAPPSLMYAYIIRYACCVRKAWDGGRHHRGAVAIINQPCMLASRLDHCELHCFHVTNCQLGNCDPAGGRRTFWLKLPSTPGQVVLKRQVPPYPHPARANLLSYTKFRGLSSFIFFLDTKCSINIAVRLRYFGITPSDAERAPSCSLHGLLSLSLRYATPWRTQRVLHRLWRT